MDWARLYDECNLFIDRYETKLMAICLDELSGGEITDAERKLYYKLTESCEIYHKGVYLGTKLKGLIYELNDIINGGTPPSEKLTNFYYEYLNISKPIIHSNFYFYTWTGFKKIRDTPENIQKLINIANAIFNNDRFKRYKSIVWKIETGKNITDSNLHIHALIKFETAKNFDRDFKAAWLREFAKEGLCELNKNAKQFYKGNKHHHIYMDKMNYLNNKDKSILHKNYRDIPESLFTLNA
ncbi:MAG: hypothetical protein [Circular genetic element sp.]|nr:MAG: hypothetical protein [Circular genetic element sp.]